MGRGIQRKKKKNIRIVVSKLLPQQYKDAMRINLALRFNQSVPSDSKSS